MVDIDLGQEEAGFIRLSADAGEGEIDEGPRLSTTPQGSYINSSWYSERLERPYRVGVLCMNCLEKRKRPGQMFCCPECRVEYYIRFNIFSIGVKNE